MSPQASRVIALTVIAMTLAAAAVGAVVSIGFPLATSPIVFLPAYVTFGVVGALVAVRRPANPIGWLFLGFALLGSLTMVAQGLAGPSGATSHTPTTDPGSGTIVEQWAAWFSMLWVEMAMTPILVAIMLFPNGRLVSRRWRWAVWLTCLTFLFGTLLTGLSDVNRTNNYPDIYDPVTPLSGVHLLSVYYAYQTVGLACLVLAGSSLVVRFRRSDTIQRLQIKWVVFATVIFLGGFFAFLGNENGPVLAFIVFSPLVPIAIGAAILRYRLFDIDRLISRTTSYVLVSAVVVVVYLVVVWAATSILPGSSTLAVAAATLTAAAVFRPVLIRVQAIIDRRFNRARYDAVLTVEGFGGQLRNEIDPDRVMVELTETIQATVEPNSLSVWLAGSS